MANRSGWAYGFTRNAGDWLTIVGSAHTTPVLRNSREDAEAALAETRLHGWKPYPGEMLATAHVTEVWHPGVGGRGVAYRITPGTDREAAKPATIEDKEA